MATRLEPYESYEGEKVAVVNDDLDVVQDVPVEALESWEAAGWKKASAKVAKAAEEEK